MIDHILPKFLQIRHFTNHTTLSQNSFNIIITNFNSLISMTFKVTLIIRDLFVEQLFL